MAFELRFLGAFQATLGERQVAISAGRKALGLLAVVAASPGRRATRERLATLLWGDRFEEQARQSLRQTLSALRRDLEAVAPAALAVDRGEISLVDCATDLDAFSRALADGDFAAAARLWRGPFAADIDIDLENWVRWRAETNQALRPGALAAFEHLARRAVAPAGVLQSVARMLELDPHNEAALRLALPHMARLHGTAAAAARFDAFAAALLRETGRAPMPETQAVYAAALAADAPAAALLPSSTVVAPQARAAAPSRRWALAAALAFPAAVGLGWAAWIASQGPGSQGEGARASDAGAAGSARFIDPSPFGWPFRFHVAEPQALDGRTPTVAAAATLAQDLRSALGLLPGSALVAAPAQADFLMETDARAGEGDRIAINLRLVERATGRVLWADTLAGAERYAGGFPEQRAVPIDTAAARAYAALLVEMDRRRAPEPAPAPETARLVAEGWAALRGGATREKVDASMAAFRQALARDPESADARTGVAHGHAMYLLNMWSERRAEEAAAASRLVAEAVERTGRQPIAFFVLGLVHKSQRDYARGLAAMRVTLQIQPQHAASYAQSAHMHLLSGDAERAVAMAELGVLLGPSANALDRALLYAGMARLLVGDYRLSAAHLARSFEINRTFPDIYAWYSAALYRAGEADDALSVYRAMRERWPAHRLDHHFLIAHSPQRMERFATAIAEIEAIAQLARPAPTAAN